MAETIAAYRVFIATPGGLSAERRKFRSTLTAYNDDEAIARGVSFWPVGWEDTLSGVGRPQALINEDVRVADYLVLALWDRWGSPPSADSGQFSSGTEEEYHIARECLADQEAPMRGIVVLFKGVSERHLSDPGEQLKKVIAFRRQIEVEKRLLYGTFDTEEEFARIIRRHLGQWVRDHQSQKAKVDTPVPPPSSGEPAHVDTAVVMYDSPEDALKAAEKMASEGHLSDAETVLARAVVGTQSVSVLLTYARFLRRHGRLFHARSIYESALELATSQQDEMAVVEALANMGVVAKRQRELGHAKDLLREAQSRIPRHGGEEWNSKRAFILGNLAHVSSDLGDAERAEELQRASLQYLGADEQEEDLANGYGTLGVILRRHRRWKEAEEAHREGIRLSEALGDQGDRSLAYNCGSLGLVLDRTGRHEDAITAHERALEINRKLGREEGEALNLGHLASVLVSLGRLDEAEQKNEAAVTINVRRGNTEGLAYNYSTRGRINERRGHNDEAARHYRDAIGFFRDVGNDFATAQNLKALAVVLLKAERTEEAYAILEQAEEIAVRTKDSELLGEIRGLRMKQRSREIVKPDDRPTSDEH